MAVCAGNARGRYDVRDGKKWNASEVEGRRGVDGADVDVLVHCMGMVVVLETAECEL